MNTWLEIAVESGLLGLATFLYALATTLGRAWKRAPGGRGLGWLVTAALAIHLGVNLNLTQTFPRLDYWLLFFFLIFLAERIFLGPSPNKINDPGQ